MEVPIFLKLRMLWDGPLRNLATQPVSWPVKIETALVRPIFNCSFSLKMDVSNDNDNQQENVCFVCQKIGSSSESSSDVGKIIKVMRGLPTRRNASAEREDGLLEF
jgi:hypothetical protein